MSMLQNKGFSAQEARNFLEMLDGNNSYEAQLASSFFFRKKLASCQEPPNEFIGTMVTKLIACLSRPQHEVQLNASWALTNLACASRKDTHRIVKAGGIFALRSLLENSRGEVRDQAIWALGNLAADCTDCRESVREANILPLLIRSLDQSYYNQLEPRKIVIWCMVNLLRSGMDDITLTDVSHILRLLHDTIIAFESTHEIVSDSIWCIAFLIDHVTLEGERIALLFERDGLVQILARFLKHSSMKILAGSLRAIGNIITGTDDQTTQILNLNILEDINVLVHSNAPQISRECVWILSNVAAGTQDHVTRLFAIERMAENIFRLCKDPSTKKRKEAFWVLVNALVGASDDIYEYLLSGGAGHILVQIVEEYLDTSLVDRALQSITNSLIGRPEKKAYSFAIFRRVGLVSTLHQLANSDRASPYDSNPELAANMLRNFFNVSPDEAMEKESQTKNEPVLIRLKRRSINSTSVLSKEM